MPNILLRSCLSRSTAPLMSLLVAPSSEFVGVIDHFEETFSNRFNHHIRFAQDAATVPLQDYLPRILHLPCEMFSIRDHEFARVQIYRRLVVVIVVVLVVYAPKPILPVIIIDCLHQGFTSLAQSTKIGFQDP